MQQARSAIAAARTTGAETYARDEFTAAQDALTQAERAVRDRDYRLALNRALDSRERAQTAATEAGDHKALARADADRLLIQAAAALADARRTSIPIPPRVSARTAATVPHAHVADDEVAVQEARAAFGAENYAAVTAALPAIIEDLQRVTHDTEVPTQTTGRRRH